MLVFMAAIDKCHSRRAAIENSTQLAAVEEQCSLILHKFALLLRLFYCGAAVRRPQAAAPVAAPVRILPQ